MTIHLPSGRVLAALVLSLLAARGAQAAAPPTAAQALRLKPVQKDVDFDTPAADEIEKCTIKPEKINGKTGWVVKSSAGQMLRNFVDTNADNTVDQWSYYKDGVEIYRDIDSNHNGKADQCRWLNTAGTRWGLDKNEDRTIDVWQVISPEEVSFEVIGALHDGDTARFARLLITPSELSSLGFGKAKLDDLEKRLTLAPAGFAEYLKNQKVVTAGSTWSYFGGNRPGLVPAGTDDSTADVMVYDNVAALTETDGKSGQVPIGTMIKVGDVWRLIDAPGEGAERNLAGSAVAQAPRSEGAPGQPSQKARDLMDEYEQLDKKQDYSVSANERRVEIIELLTEEAKTPEDKAQWIRQEADVISEAVQRGKFPGGIERLTALREKCASNGQEELVAYVQFRVMTAAYNLSLSGPNPPYKEIQDKWLADLEQYVKEHPTSVDSAEAMLQLAIAQEFAGDDTNAVKWYGRVIANFPKSAAAIKSEGAKRRIESVGHSISLKSKTLGGKAFDLAQLKGKVVLIHYWSSDIEACRTDMAQLERMMKKYGDSFVVIGVSLDGDRESLTAYVRENGFLWPQLWEDGGLGSRLANEMGILTLPTMLLVDKQGNVLSRNVSANGLDGELKQILKPQVASRPKNDR